MDDTTTLVRTHRPFIESWRVVTHAALGTPATSDATVRVRAGERRLLIAGEGASGEAALEQAMTTAARILGQSTSDPRSPSLPHDPDSIDVGSREVVVDAVHEAGLLGRLAVLLNTHRVSSFAYDELAGTVRVRLLVHGGDWQAHRVASKLRRVISVTAVTLGPSAP